VASEIEEKEAIRDLISRYCFETDRHADPDAWAGLFAEDGIWDGEAFGRYQGHEQLRGFMSKATSGGQAGFRHYTANVLIDVNGDTAQGKCYFLLMQASDDGPKPFFVGYYEDKFVKQGGKWLFKERVTRST
jgi:hypothetical protein